MQNDIPIHCSYTKLTDVTELVPHPRNPNKHGDKQIALLAKIIRHQGWRSPVVVSKRSGFIVAGHGRLQAAQLLQVQSVPVDFQDFATEADEYAHLVADNRIAELAEIDGAELSALLKELDGKIDMDLTGFDTEAIAELGALTSAPSDVDAEPQISKADELREKWKTECGQIWKLGEHRLMCGDSTNADVVGLLMVEDRAEMVWTDPPYGVAVGDKNKFLNSIARSNRVEENLQNDTLDEDGIRKMLSASFDNAMEHCAAGASWYVAAPAGPLHLLFGEALKDRKIWRQTIQWVKNNSTFSPMGVCYHWQSEPIFFGWLPNGGHRWHGGRQQTTVWNIDRPQKSPEHPTMKPVELVARAIENSSRQGEIVYEPFSGSGTTIIACEQLGRKCRAMEISPAYVAVALQRWADATGKTPELLNA